MGPWTFLVGCITDGQSIIDPGGSAQNQRDDPSEPDYLHLAKPYNRCHYYACVDKRRIPVGSKELHADG
jgi:hypothetical protein